MYENALKELTGLEHQIVKRKVFLNTLEKLNLNFEANYLGLNSRGIVLFCFNNYEEIIRVLRQFRLISGEALTLKMNWTVDDKILFSWENASRNAEVWGRFPVDQIPEQLLGNCRIEEIEIPSAKEKRLVCDV